MQTFKIGKNEAGQRFDKFLAKYLPGAPKSLLYKQLRKKNITLNGRKASGEEIITIGDNVETFFSDETYEKFRGEISAAPISNKPSLLPVIIYEDDDILILDKPAGMLSQKAEDKDYSVNDFLTDHLLEEGRITKESLRTFKPSICNRLDRNTSGLMICGCSLAGVQEMTRIIREGLIGKYYRTICTGRIDKAFTAEGNLQKDIKSNKSKISDNDEGKYIKTDFKPLDNYGDKATLLEVCLHTGKPHQIRAQLSELSHPIWGDRKYGFEGKGNVPKYQLLQSYKIVFPNSETLLNEKFGYLTGKVFEIPLPDLFIKTIKAL